MAVEKRNPEIVKLLLENESIDPNKINIIRDQNLQETYGNDDYYTITALYYIIDKDNLYNFNNTIDVSSKIEIIKLLLSNEKTDPNIIIYIKKRDYEAGDNYIKKETAFFNAVEQKNYEIVELLLTNKKIDLNIKCTYIELDRDDCDGKFIEDEPNIRTPLEFASGCSNKAIFELLEKYQSCLQAPIKSPNFFLTLRPLIFHKVIKIKE